MITHLPVSQPQEEAIFPDFAALVADERDYLIDPLDRRSLSAKVGKFRSDDGPE
jgi:hypothetical protein